LKKEAKNRAGRGWKIKINRPVSLGKKSFLRILSGGFV